MIYLAGPYASETFEQHKFNIGRLLTYYTHLQKIVTDPIICPPLESAGFDKGIDELRNIDWIGKCLALVTKSDTVFFVPCWIESYGCNCEHYKAEESEIDTVEMGELTHQELVSLRHDLLSIRNDNPFAKWALEYIEHCIFLKMEEFLNTMTSTPL